MLILPRIKYYLLCRLQLLELVVLVSRRELCTEDKVRIQLLCLLNLILVLILLPDGLFNRRLPECVFKGAVSVLILTLRQVLVRNVLVMQAIYTKLFSH